MQSNFYQILSHKYYPKTCAWEINFVSIVVCRSLDDASSFLERWFFKDSQSGMFESVYPKRDSAGRVVQYVAIYDSGVEIHYDIQVLSVL